MAWGFDYYGFVRSQGVKLWYARLLVEKALNIEFRRSVRASGLEQFMFETHGIPNKSIPARRITLASDGSVFGVMLPDEYSPVLHVVSGAKEDRNLLNQKLQAVPHIELIYRYGDLRRAYDAAGPQTLIAIDLVAIDRRTELEAQILRVKDMPYGTLMDALALDVDGELFGFIYLTAKQIENIESYLPGIEIDHERFKYALKAETLD